MLSIKSDFYFLFLECLLTVYINVESKMNTQVFLHLKNVSSRKERKMSHSKKNQFYV